MIVLKTANEIEALREAGRVVALAHAAMRAAAAPGVTLKELDSVAADVLAEHGATSAFLGYQPHFASSPFPGVICASINDQIVHGIPTEYALQEGDLVSIDFGAVLGGWVGDAAVTFPVGEPRDQADADLIECTDTALAAGIEAAVVGNRIGDISHAIATIARRHGYGMPEGWGGHGVGREMHEDPSVPNDGKPGRGLRLKPGLVIAIEPMFIAGGDDSYRLADDGWTVLTTDGSNAAHSEHTIAITENGPRILTLP
ncbi:MAG: type I methionyl aminopeptidase [Actinobacteria bacterium]|nr:type I methionyl aminopeptidase [Actinomycetota bacterium]